ncbi:MAG: glycosyltransferase family 4 protein [Pyrinomonadaceae bacterium]
MPSKFDTSPGQRFRLEQWEPLLQQRGVEITYAPFEDDELHAVLYQAGSTRQKLRLVARAFQRRLSLLRSVRDYDLVYVFREASLLGPPVFERLIHRTGVPLIFDFDDAIFVPYVSPANPYLSWLKQASKTRTICRLASHVMAGNFYLAEYAGAVNSHVTIVPTTIDTEKYYLSEQRKTAEPPVIVWSGSFSTVQHLDTLRKVLQRLAKQENFRLRVIGTPNYKLEGVEVESMSWRAQTEVQDLGTADIGIMPLPDDRWSKGKCGLKALQYMALGIPTICSPVGVNSEIIQDGQNGMIACTEDEWIARFTQLLRSPELRNTLGQAGRKTVETKYSAVVQAPRVFAIFDSVCRGLETIDEQSVSKSNAVPSRGWQRRTDS